MSRKALGRGLDALLGEVAAAAPVPARPAVEAVPAPAGAPAAPERSGLLRVSITDIEPNPDQPRREIRPEDLADLASSIRSQGVLQPLLVTPRAEGGYFLIAGERRWQASKLAGLKEVPCLVRPVTAHERLALALIENIQRQDLNPLEEAQAYARLAEEFRLTQEQISQAVGRDRATVANFLRLLKLPDAVKGDLVEGRLSMGHARALLGLVDSPPKLLSARAKVLHKRLSVRETEQLVDRLSSPRSPRRPASAAGQLSAEADSLRSSLGTKVSINRRGQRGRIVIEFFSDEELDRLLDLLKRVR